MFLQDGENIYIKLPNKSGSFIVKAISQSLMSLKQDRTSSTEHIDFAEMVLVQLMNGLHTAEFIDETKSGKFQFGFEAEDANGDSSNEG